ncbi:MAG: hypothetical protein ACK5C9_21115, partial [Pseudanabaena sp.]
MIDSKYLGIALYSNVRDRSDNSKPKRWQSFALPSFGFYVLSKAYIAIATGISPYQMTFIGHE